VKLNYFTATNVLIALCATVFLLDTLTSNSTTHLALYYWGSPSFQSWQFLSHLFVHGSLMHLVFNMLGLWMFGRVLEQVWGTVRFVFFYLACGIGAAAVYQLVSHYQFQAAIQPLLDAGVSLKDIVQIFTNGQYYVQYPSSEQAVRIFSSPVMGASGAIYGVLAGFAYCFPNHKLIFLLLPWPIPAKFFVPALLAFDLYASVTGFSVFGANIAHEAHIGGAVVGFLLAVIIMRKRNLVLTGE
jgi:membrane associated rhomboid family serine protease